MKRFFLIFIFVLSIFTITNAQNGVCLRHNNTDLTIVIPADFTNEQADAATQLQHYLKVIYGGNFPMIADCFFHGEHYISIGKTLMAKEVDSLYSSDILDDGFLLHTDNGNLYIFGNERKSELYGVCHFLENYLDCYMMDPKAMHLPNKAIDTCLIIHDLQNPDFAYREVLHPFPNISQEYADWYKMQNRQDLFNNWTFLCILLKTWCPQANILKHTLNGFLKSTGDALKTANSV